MRDHNEDCIDWSGWALHGEVTQRMSMELTITEPTAVVVCDGMGGHAAGETAWRLAATLITAPGPLGEATEESVTALLQRVSDAINDAALSDPTLAGMGCTVVGLVLHPDGNVCVFNVGDSRCYRLEGQCLAQLSVDHRSTVSAGHTRGASNDTLVLALLLDASAETAREQGQRIRDQRAEEARGRVRSAASDLSGNDTMAVLFAGFLAITVLAPFLIGHFLMTETFVLKPDPGVYEESVRGISDHFWATYLGGWSRSSCCWVSSW